MPKKKIDPGDQNLKRFSLNLVLTRNCNLNCSYCYEKSHLKNDRVMDFNLAKEVITHYMEKDDDFNAILIEFFGGEPMLAFSLIKDIVEWFHSRTWKKRHVFQIATNGTILTDKMKKWLLKYRKCVVMALSFDGCKIAHNLTRDNSYDLVYPNIPFIKKYWGGQPFKMTITSETIPYLFESIVELEEMEVNFTANVVFENIWGDEDKKSELLGIFEDQLSELVDYYAERPHLYPVFPLLDTFPEYLGLPDSELEEDLKRRAGRFCGSGNEMIAVDVDGKTFPCHRFLPWVCGKSIPGELAIREKQWKPEKCYNCKLLAGCPTCAGLNWEENEEPSFRTTYHCEAYKLQVLASAKLEAIRLSQKGKAELEKLSQKGKANLALRLEAALNIVENGI